MGKVETPDLLDGKDVVVDVEDGPGMKTTTQSAGRAMAKGHNKAPAKNNRIDEISKEKETPNKTYNDTKMTSIF